MEEKPSRKAYPTDVTDEEWGFIAPFLTLMREDALQRTHDLREIFSALRWIVRTGAHWRYLPTNFPPWAAVYQQTQRWVFAGVFDYMVHYSLTLLRWSEGRADAPTAVILDGRTVQSKPECGARSRSSYGRRSAIRTPASCPTTAGCADNIDEQDTIRRKSRGPLRRIGSRGWIRRRIVRTHSPNCGVLDFRRFHHE